MKYILLLQGYNNKNKRKKSIYKFSLSDYIHLFFGIWTLNQEMRIQLRVESLQLKCEIQFGVKGFGAWFIMLSLSKHDIPFFRRCVNSRDAALVAPL
jgi:hypothetical protein